MKKALEIISASGLLLGLVFKLFHWPGCDLLLIFSLGLFIPIFYLSELVSGWKSKPSKFLILVNFLALSTLTESILFKLMHWPGSDMMLIISLWFLWPIYFISKGIIQKLFWERYLSTLKLDWFSLLNSEVNYWKFIRLVVTTH